MRPNLPWIEKRDDYDSFQKTIIGVCDLFSAEVFSRILSNREHQVYLAALVWGNGVHLFSSHILLEMMHFRPEKKKEAI